MDFVLFCFLLPEWEYTYIYWWCNSIKLFIQTDGLLWFLLVNLCLGKMTGWKKKILSFIAVAHHNTQRILTASSDEYIITYMMIAWAYYTEGSRLRTTDTILYSPMQCLASSCYELVIVCILHSMPQCVFWTSPPHPSLYSPGTFLTDSVCMACSLAVLSKISGRVASLAWPGMVTIIHTSAVSNAGNLPASPASLYRNCNEIVYWIRMIQSNSL